MSGYGTSDPRMGHRRLTTHNEAARPRRNAFAALAASCAKNSLPLGRRPANAVPPGTGPSHEFVVAFHHLNRGASRLNEWVGCADVLEQALVAPEAAEGGHLNRGLRIVDLLAAPTAFHVNVRRGAHVIGRHQIVGM